MIGQAIPHILYSWRRDNPSHIFGQTIPHSHIYSGQEFGNRPIFRRFVIPTLRLTYSTSTYSTYSALFPMSE